LPFEQIRHLTTGGESALQLLAGKPLPAVAALDDEPDVIAPIERRARRILLAADGSESSLEAARQLGSLVDTEGAEISLVHVQKPIEMIPEGIFFGAETRRQREIERRLEAEKLLAEAHAQLVRQGLKAERSIIAEGDPASGIIKVADETGADLIAMGSHGHSGVVSFFLGSVSRKVLDHAHCPVLIVRMAERDQAESEAA
jgi:nucleotide-binding universal stress UspA family protein